MKRDNFFSRKYGDYLPLLLIVLVGSLTLGLNFGQIPPLNPWSDESEIAADAVETLREGPRLFYPGQLAGGSLAVWVEAGWMALFGPSLTGLRLLNGLLNLTSALLLYLLVARLPLSLPRRGVALAAALLFAGSTWLLGLGRIAAPNWSLTPLLTNLAFYAFWRGLAASRRPAFPIHRAPPGTELDRPLSSGGGAGADPNPREAKPGFDAAEIRPDPVTTGPTPAFYFGLAGLTMGLLFYGYLPGYFVPAVPLLFLSLVWSRDRRGYPSSAAQPSFSRPRLPTAIFFLLGLPLLVAAPMLLFFMFNPAATLQRPLQLAATNELSGLGPMVQAGVDLLSTFGLYPNRLWQGRFEHLAFDPLTTGLFVIGALVALWRRREPGYLFLLIWWGVMIAPAWLSRSASLGFIFEVWRRGVGAQPVSFIFAAVGLLTLIQGFKAGMTGAMRPGSIFKTSKGTGVSGFGRSGSSPVSPGAPEQILPAGRPGARREWPGLAGVLLIFGAVVVSAGLSYWLYFDRWANSGALPALFAEEPVRLVDWLERAGPETLFIFPIRPQVSPTTRPDLFTVRYLHDGPARTAFPPLDEATIDRTLAALLAGDPALVTLMLPERIPVDPKGYFAYALGSRGRLISQETRFGYTATIYRLRPAGETDRLSGRPGLSAASAALHPPREAPAGAAHDLQPPAAPMAAGALLQLTGQHLQPASPAAGQTLGLALRGKLQRPTGTDYNLRVSLIDAQGYEWVARDKPFLSAGDYLPTRHWPPGAESTLYYALPVPPDAPPGRYTLTAVVYNEATGERLPVAVSSQADLSFPVAAVTVAPNPDPVDPAALPISHALGIDFPAGLRLAGLAPPASPQRPGEPLSLTVWWQAQTAPARTIGLTLALVAPDGEPISLFDAPRPLIAGFPTPAWRPGQTYRAPYSALPPATLSANDYDLVLALLDLETGELLAWQRLAALAIESRQHVFEAPPLTQPRRIDFGRTIRLTGFELANPVAALGPDQPLRLKLQWQALRAPAESYKLFVHLLDESGRIISQVDTVPRQGAAPTTSWLPGEVIEDEIALPVPADISPEWRLIVGWYEAQSGRRLRSDDRDHAVLVEGP